MATLTAVNANYAQKHQLKPSDWVITWQENKAWLNELTATRNTSDKMRKIIHCDADCFFAAVEIIKQPKLYNQPVAVGGSPTQRGVIAACNYPARRYGVRSAMASAYARRLCPQLIIIKPNMQLYREYSQAMHCIFNQYTNLIEPLSLDEAYLDVSASGCLKGSATLIAQEIRQRIKSQLNLTVSAGVSSNKFLAKVASGWNKPDGLTVISPQQINGFVKQLSVSKIPGVGKVTARKLKQMGISICAELQLFTVEELSAKFGAYGQRLFKLSRGIDNKPVNPARRRRSLSVEKTYPQDLINYAACHQQLPTLLAELNQRLSKAKRHYLIKKIMLKITFYDFHKTTISRTGQELNKKNLQQMLKQAFARGNKPVRLLGVGVGFADDTTEVL